MRMRESEDYITARGANPRTGLISPSVVTLLSPRTPLTPGEALSLFYPDTVSSKKKDRPRLARTGANQHLHYDERDAGHRTSPWHVSDNTGKKGLGPILGQTSPSEQQETPDRGSGVEEDCFILHMPSAKEPQPYIFPGHTSAQIAAYHHYAEKSRKVSGKIGSSPLSDLFRSSQTEPASTNIGSDISIPRKPLASSLVSTATSSPSTALNDCATQSTSSTVPPAPYQPLPSLVLDPRTAPSSSTSSPTIASAPQSHRRPSHSDTEIATFFSHGEQDPMHCERADVKARPGGLKRTHGRPYTPRSDSPPSPPYPVSRERNGVSPSYKAVRDLRQLPRIYLTHPGMAGVPVGMRRRDCTDTSGLVNITSLDVEEEKPGEQLNSITDRTGAMPRQPHHSHGPNTAEQTTSSPSPHVILPLLQHILTTLTLPTLPLIHIQSRNPSQTATATTAATSSLPTLIISTAYVVLVMYIAVCTYQFFLGVKEFLFSTVIPLTMIVSVGWWVLGGG